MGTRHMTLGALAELAAAAAELGAGDSQLATNIRWAEPWTAGVATGAGVVVAECWPCAAAAALTQESLSKLLMHVAQGTAGGGRGLGRARRRGA
jgi:hypothetical protein